MPNTPANPWIELSIADLHDSHFLVARRAVRAETLRAVRRAAGPPAAFPFPSIGLDAGPTDSSDERDTLVTGNESSKCEFSFVPQLTPDTRGVWRTPRPADRPDREGLLPAADLRRT